MVRYSFCNHSKNFYLKGKDGHPGGGGVQDKHIYIIIYYPSSSGLYQEKYENWEICLKINVLGGELKQKNWWAYGACYSLNNQHIKTLH